jgi:hypothetical protein
VTAGGVTAGRAGALLGAGAGALAGAAADVTADGVEVDGVEVAACACLENTSKTIRIPAAKIATCTARRAMCRNKGWDTSSSRPSGEAGVTVVATISSRNLARATRVSEGLRFTCFPRAQTTISTMRRVPAL